MRTQLALAGMTVVAHAAMTVLARAQPPILATLAPATDARRAIAIGPAGQVYEPDGKGAWVRTHAGGLAAEVVASATAGGSVIAGAKNAPPFRLRGGAWNALDLGLKAKAILGAGSRAVAAVGKGVFALDGAVPKKLAEAPAPVLALGSSKAGVVIATDRGLLRLQGTAFKPVKGPKRVQALLDDRWALVDRGALDLKTMKAYTWPAGLRVGDAMVVGDGLVAVASHGKALELVTIKAGALAHEKVPAPDPSAVVGVVADAAGRVVIAMRDGTLAVRDGASWTATTVRESLAPAKPGPAPATSK